MEPTRSLACIALLLCIAVNPGAGQLPAGSHSWSGQGSLTVEPAQIAIGMAPAGQYYFSPRLSAGGQLQFNGNIFTGVQQILAEPEMRYYLHPRARRWHWFAMTGARAEIFRAGEPAGEPDFQWRAGFGALTMLPGGVMLESKLFASFQRTGSQSFFEAPGLALEVAPGYFQSRSAGPRSGKGLPAVGRGSWIAGGSRAALRYIQIPAAQYLIIHFSPRLAYFLSDRFALGAELPFRYENLNTDFMVETKNFGFHTTYWGIAPLLRYYPGNRAGALLPFLELEASWTFQETIFTPFSAVPPDEREFRYRSARLSGGLDLFLTTHVALEASLQLIKDLGNGKARVGLHTGFQFFLLDAD